MEQGRKGGSATSPRGRRRRKDCAGSEGVEAGAVVVEAEDGVEHGAGAEAGEPVAGAARETVGNRAASAGTA